MSRRGKVVSRLSLVVVLVSIVAAACAAPTRATPRDAAAMADPQPAQRQAPGFHRVVLGDFLITALSDGTMPLDVDEVLTGTTRARIDEALAKAYLASPVETSFNAYLIDTGSKLVLIDTGAGSLLGPTLGKLSLNLAAAGHAPEEIDEVYVTHLHVDHAGGLMVGNARAFPNAIVRADRQDVDYWLSDENRERAPERMRAFFDGARASLGPYIDAGKLRPFDGDTVLVPGVRAVAAHGHTPGHTIYEAESRGHTMRFWGDLLHVAAVQMPTPSVTIVFDVDSAAAAAQRRKAFDHAAARGYLVASAHISFPGIGRLRRDGRGFAWMPLNYSSLAN